MRFTRLSQQILIIFVTVVALSLGLSGWTITALAQRIVADNVAQGHQELVRRIAEEIDLAMEDIRPILSLLTESAPVQSMDADTVAAELIDYQIRFPALTSVYVADLTGQQLARTDGLPLENVETIYGFQVAREGYELLSDIYLSQEGHVPTLTAYLPITDAPSALPVRSGQTGSGGGGQVVGVLVADVNFARVQAVLETLALTRDETAVVLASNGRIVAHSRLAEMAEPPAFTDALVAANLARGQAGLLEDYTDELGRTVVGVHAPATELDWGVVIQTPVGELASQVAALRRTMVMGLIGGIALAVMTGWLMARRLTDPIVQLVRATEQVTAGDLTAAVDVTASNEIGRLADAFNQMVAGIQQAQQALQESEARYRGLFEDSPISLWEEDFSAVKDYLDSLRDSGVTDLGAYLENHPEMVRRCAAMVKVVDVNKATLEMLHCKNREELLVDLGRIFREESYDVFREELIALAEGQAIFETGTTNQTLDGDEIHVDLKLTLAPGHEETWSKVFLSLADVTQRVRAEKALQKHREHLEELVAARTAELTAANEQLEREVMERKRMTEDLVTLYQTGRDLVATLDLEALLPTIAQRVTDTLKADRCAVFLFDERVGVLRARAAHGYMAERLADFSYRPGEEIVGRAYTTGETQYVPNLDQVPDLPRRDEIRAVLAVPLASPTAGPLGVLSVTSLRPQAFTPGQQLLLETMADQIAGAIQNARLYEAAQEADRLKSAFLATMSHELRTPLNSIIGFTGILLQGLVGPLNAEQTKQLGMVQSSARHLLDLINDVLDLSKIEAGQLEIASEQFDMRELIEKAVHTVTPLIEKKDLALVVDIAPEVGQVVSDQRRVEQILINLVNNAIKFTEKGKVRVECRVDDGRLVTRVIDTGIGIKPEDTDTLFQPFRQIDTGITRRREGTGLGLSICKKLIGLLGGEIWVESEWGVGSTFTFALPECRMQDTKRET